MNCQNFETVVGDLARGVPLEARAREAAGAHEASCARCAARLADERALSAGLRGLAAGTQEAAAPPRVEANLLAAFRARAAGQAGPPPAVEKLAPAATNVVALVRPAAARRWGWAKTIGAAAAAAAAAVTLLALVRPQGPAPAERAATPGAMRPRVDFAPPVSPPASSPVTPTTAVDNSRDGASDEVAVIAPRATNAHRAASARPAAVYQNAAARSPRGARTAPAPRDEEIATDFIPLTQDARFAVSEGAQVVRVELPRSALQRFGLPMNVERAGGRVKADVLLGHDGVARAIRFVR